MADSRVGFDRPIYLTGEETTGRVQENGNFEAETFDRSRGAQTVAIFENDDGEREIHALSDFGFFAKENTVVAPNTGNKTVAFSLEDGPQAPDSQRYMYVGEKQKSGTVLERNGLVGGKLYVFVSSDPSRNSEATFENGNLGAAGSRSPGRSGRTRSSSRRRPTRGAPSASSASRTAPSANRRTSSSLTPRATRSRAPSTDSA